MLDIEVIEDPAAAEASLDPIRTRILLELAEPGSATQLAARVGLPRQKVNYHLKALERHGLVELVEERRRGNVTERILGDGGVVPDFAGGPGLRGAGPAPVLGPLFRVLAAGPRRPHGPGDGTADRRSGR